MREGHGVGLVAHAQALPTVLPGVLERVANDALHALSGVDVLLNGNFVGGVLLEDPANTDIQAFGVLLQNLPCLWRGLGPYAIAGDDRDAGFLAATSHRDAGQGPASSTAAASRLRKSW